ncbi:MAG: hypothetical protein HRU19_06890 [Pseudobacteriovorax sp.]|nr:hypothetical protein [Pseudobacteriovorax sp.]
MKKLIKLTVFSVLAFLLPVEVCLANDIQKQIEGMKKRESKLGKKLAKVSGFDNKIALKIPSKAKIKTEQSQGFFQFPVSIGSDLPVTCQVYESPVSLGSFLQQIYGNLEKQKFQKSLPQNTEVFKVGDKNALRFSFEYVTPKKQLGSMKVAYGVIGLDARMICFHDELGYQKTFDKLFKRILKGTSLKEDFELVRSDLYKTEVNGLAVGFSLMSFYKGANGTLVEASTGFNQFPRSKTDVMMQASNSAKIFHENKLIQGIFAADQGGMNTHQIDLSVDDKGAYLIKGTYQGEPVNKTLKSKEPIQPETLRASIIKTLKKPKVFYDYSPEIDPVAVIKYQVKPKGKKQFEAQLDKVKFNVKIQNNGFMDSMNMKMGSATFTQTLVSRD